MTQRLTGGDHRHRRPPREPPLSIDNIRDAVFLVDDETRVVRFCNQAVEKLFGYSADDLVGRTTEVLHVDADHFLFFGRDSQYKVTEHGYFKSRFSMKRRDGTSFPSTNIVLPTHSVGGRPTAISIVRDDSGSLEEISESDALLNEIARCVADAWGLNAVLTGVLSSLCRYFQWDCGEVWLHESGRLVLKARWDLTAENDESTDSISGRARPSTETAVEGRVHESNKPLWLCEPAGRPGTGSAAEGTPLGTVCGVPARAHGGFAAVAVFAARQRCECNLATQGLMEYVWALVAPTLRDLAAAESSISTPRGEDDEPALTQQRSAARERTELLQRLSKRERDVADSMVQGLLTKEIAHKLGLSQRTIEGYRAALKRKLKARTLPELTTMLANLLRGTRT